MIVLGGLHAKLTCVEPGCTDSLPTQIVLLPTGGFGAKFESKFWQVMHNPQNPGAAYMCRCPRHAQKVQAPPVVPSIRIEGH